MGGLSTQLFIGCRVTSFIDAHLRKSRRWVEERVAPPKDSLLKLIQYEGQPFLGYYISGPLTEEELQNIQANIFEEILYYCPKLERHQLTLRIFSQVFIN